MPAPSPRADTIVTIAAPPRVLHRADLIDPIAGGPLDAILDRIVSTFCVGK